MRVATDSSVNMQAVSYTHLDVYKRQVLQFPANTPVENVRARITDYLKTKDAQATPPSQRDPVEYDAEANIIMGDYQPRYVKDDAIRSAAFAVGVPISILMVGWALLWIGRGFRRQR